MSRQRLHATNFRAQISKWKNSFGAAVLLSTLASCGPTRIDGTNNRNDNENGGSVRYDPNCSRTLYEGTIGKSDTIIAPLTTSTHLRFSFRRYFDANTRDNEIALDVNEMQCNNDGCQSREIVRDHELFAPVQLQLSNRGQMIYVNLQLATYRGARVNISMGENFLSAQRCPNYVPSYRECEVTNQIVRADLSLGRTAFVDRLRLGIIDDGESQLLVQDTTYETEPYNRRLVPGQTLTLRTLDDQYYGIKINENAEMTAYACR